jgi:hypothetical protein
MNPEKIGIVTSLSKWPLTNRTNVPRRQPLLR